MLKKYNNFKLKKSTETIKDICYPQKYELQPQQKFLPEYLSDHPKIKGLLIFHKIGSGKTCTAIRICEKFKNKMKILVILPAALIGNFKDEIKSLCTDFNYTDDNISEYYEIYSYNKFVNKVKENEIKLKNTLLVIDEIQNMISLYGSFYTNLKKVIDKSDDKTKIIVLTGTPMFDQPNEIGLILNLLKPKKEFPIGTEFNNMFLKKEDNHYQLNDIDLFQKMSKNMISYFRGAPPIAFPKKIFNVVKCKMSDFQYKSYLTSISLLDENIKGIFKNVDILNISSNFFIGQRMVLNIAYPNKSYGEVGYSSLTKSAMENIKNYSIKFYKIYKNIKKSEGLIFIYSNFKDYGGLKALIHFLEFKGFKNYNVFGEGRKRYAIWSGDESHEYKENIKHVFNNVDNTDGSKIKIILGSPSIKEGVSLLRIEQIHILEPYWNISRIEQIIGRGIRYCSHKDLSKKYQQVEIFLYLSVFCNNEENESNCWNESNLSIDQYIWSLANKKNKLIQEFEHKLKENALDCKLFFNRNYYKTDKNKLKCLISN
jgi:superfamily II DNA or RNA helicase